MSWVGDRRFRPVLERLGAFAFDDSCEPIYGLWPDLTFAYFNGAWIRHARAAGGEPIRERWPLGGPVLASCDPALRTFYADVFTRALDEGDARPQDPPHPVPLVSPWSHIRVLAPQGALLVCHTPVGSGLAARGRRRPQFDPAIHQTSGGLALQCFHCRRLRTVAGPEPDRWELVPSVAANEPSRPVSHVVCPICVAYRYHRHLTPPDLQTVLEEALVAAKKRL